MSCWAASEPFDQVFEQAAGFLDPYIESASIDCTEHTMSTPDSGVLYLPPHQPLCSDPLDYTFVPYAPSYYAPPTISSLSYTSQPMDRNGNVSTTSTMSDCSLMSIDSNYSYLSSVPDDIYSFNNDIAFIDLDPPPFQNTYAPPMTNNFTTTPSKDFDGKSAFPCLHPGCYYISARKADLIRHESARHTPPEKRNRIDCPVPGCARKGVHGLPRADKLNEHLREKHKQEIEKRVGRKR